MSDQNPTAPPADPLKPYKGRFAGHDRIPSEGRDQDDIFRELATMAAEENARWQSGRVSGTFYHGGQAHRVFLNKVFALFAHANTIQFDLCPSMFKLESEIIAMTARMLNGDIAATRDPADQVCGTLTSGGTESILMAMKAYRDWARAEKGISAPQILMPHTAHPAFDKAGQYFGIEMVHVPVAAPDFRVDPAEMEQRITADTIALVGSAGNYPYGLIDPLEDLSKIALRHGIGMHVDGCLGGFILPWIEKLGYPVPAFDFRLPGVASMSADTHKYGFALKGTSVVLYRRNVFRRHQYFGVPDWPGGLYASPTASGSRSGGLTAATWAAMVYLGEEGYLAAVRAIMGVADAIKQGIAAMPELSLIGEPTFVISFRSDAVDVYHINDFMKTHGWRFNVLQLPPALHFCLTLPQTVVPGLADQFLADLREGVAYARDRAGTTAETTALYGMAGSLEGNRQMTEIMFGALDHLYAL